MKRLINLIIFISFFSFSAYSETYRSQNPIHVHALISVVGSGFSSGYNFNEQFQIGIDYSSISYDSTGTSDESNYSANISFSSYNLFSRFFFIDDYSFFLQGGLLNRDWNATGEYYKKDTGFKWGKIEILWPSVALNYGLGWNGVASFGLSGVVMLYGVYGDAASVTYTEYGNYAFNEDRKKEFNDSLSGLNNPTGLLLAIGYNF